MLGREDQRGSGRLGRACVDDVLDARGFRGVDDVLVLREAPAQLVRRDQQQLVQPGDGRVQRRPIVVVRHPDLDARADRGPPLCRDRGRWPPRPSRAHLSSNCSTTKRPSCPLAPVTPIFICFSSLSEGRARALSLVDCSAYGNRSWARMQGSMCADELGHEMYGSRPTTDRIARVRELVRNRVDVIKRTELDLA